MTAVTVLLTALAGPFGWLILAACVYTAALIIAAVVSAVRAIIRAWRRDAALIAMPPGEDADAMLKRWEDEPGIIPDPLAEELARLLGWGEHDG